MKHFFLRVTLSERLLVAALALLATWAFFYEYIPPFKRVHVYSDIEGYHYPLQRYAFQALKQGRLPQWDPSIYCGITFVGNIQAALLYPPSWIMYAASWGYRRIPFKALEDFAFLHMWLAFLLCYFWFRSRGLDRMAAILGACVFAYGGYMVSQCIHLGVVTGLAWMPLGLWGIDDAVSRSDWRPLWKTALASALCFLAGYPPTWVVFCATTFVYALSSKAHWRAAAGACGAIAASLLLAMVQVLPTAQAQSLMVFGEKYGGGAHSWRALIPLFVPNWYDYNRHSTVPYPDDTVYLYLGLGGIFAIAWALRRADFRPYLQPLLTGTFCLVLATNPFFWVYRILVRTFLERMAQSYNFYEGVTAMAALFTALSVNNFLRHQPRRRLPGWVLPAAIAALLTWSVREVLQWRHGGTFPTGMRALLLTAVSVLLFSIAMWVFRAQQGARRAWLAVVLVLSLAADYKVFGTSRRFNTVDGDADETEDATGIRGVNATAYQALWNNRFYRASNDEQGAPNSTDYRRWGLASPQGFDPFLPAQYHDVIEQWVHFSTNREFHMDFFNPEMLQSLAVRYVFTHEGVGNDPRLSASPDFRLVGKDDSFYRIYEYQHARPPFGWEDTSGEIQLTSWQPERRTFQVASQQGGRFFLVEQFFPGWEAFADGRRLPLERWHEAFQSVRIPSGRHDVAFEFHTPYLWLGAVISLAAFAALILLIAADRRRNGRTNLGVWQVQLSVRTALSVKDIAAEFAAPEAKPEPLDAPHGTH